MTRFAILSDIHGNAVALEAVRKAVDASAPDHVAVAAERVDAMVVLAAERMEERGEGIPELTALAVDLLMHGRARVLRDADLLAQAETPAPTGKLALPLSAEEAPGAMPEGTVTVEEKSRLLALALEGGLSSAQRIHLSLPAQDGSDL